MPRLVLGAVAALVLVSTPAFAQEASVVSDLDSQNPVKLTKEELNQLLPGAKMSRNTARGNTHTWTNEIGGSFVVRSDGRSQSGIAGAVPGKWHVSDDGRYCVSMDWKGAPEEWCRVLIKAGDKYYAANSGKKTDKVFLLEIRK
jgi:hypothetical protein